MNVQDHFSNPAPSVFLFFMYIYIYIYILRVLFFKSLLCLYGRQQILKHRDEYDKKWNDVDSFVLS